MTLSFDALLQRPVVLGFGVTSQAVVRALVGRGIKPLVLDDRPSEAGASLASELGVELRQTPHRPDLDALLGQATVLLPSPGVPDHHQIFAAAVEAAVPIASEFDLAQHWDDRPLVAITGSNGKTTVTMMVTDALNRSGISAAAVGNTDLPLVAAIEDRSTKVFVVEASSFRLAHSLGFRPAVATWLNFAPDHLDAHGSLEAYESAKACVWAGHVRNSESVAISNLADPIVRKHAPESGRVESFGNSNADWTVKQGWLVGPVGRVVEVAKLGRRQPHDLDNAAAAAATALAAGASIEGVSEMLKHFEGLDHRLQPVIEVDGVTWYDDSKATVPQATLAAVSGFDSVVLISGGRNKGLDLAPLRQAVPPVKAVVAIGESAAAVAEVFDTVVPVLTGAADMAAAVAQAGDLATPGDVVILSPSCASFDWYKNYVERGRDFARLATARASKKAGL